LTRITFHDPSECHLFCVGDLVSGSGSEIVVRVDHEQGEIVTAPATRIRRAWYWCRAQVKQAWWWIRCTWADARVWLIWCLHMLAPERFARWHTGRLDSDTLRALAENDWWPHRKGRP